MGGGATRPSAAAPAPRARATAADRRVAARKARESQARRARIASASTALDEITSGLLSKGRAGPAARASASGVGEGPPHLARVATSRLFVGKVESTVPCPVTFYADRAEYDFLYPRRGKVVHMVMRFGDMRRVWASSPDDRMPPADERCGKGSTWLAFDVAGPLEQFAGDLEARASGRGITGRVLLAFPTPSALLEVQEKVVSRAHALRRLWRRRG